MTQIKNAEILHRWPLLQHWHPRFQKIFLLSFVTLVAYWCVRLEFLAWNWPQFQGKAWSDIATAFLIGTRFDLAVTCGALIIPYFLSLAPWGAERGEKIWRILLAVSFIPLQWSLLILNFVDNEMINLAGRRFTAETLFLFREAKGGQLVGLLQTYWKLYTVNTILLLLILYAFFRIVRLNLASAQNENIQNFKSRMPSWKFAVQAFVLFALILIGSRGGLQKKPITYVQANVFAAPLLNNMILNSSFTIAKSLNQDKLPRVHYFQERQQMHSLLNANLAMNASTAHAFFQEKPNIVIIILEGFALEYMGRQLRYSDADPVVIEPDKNWTPFLNQLAEKSIFFENAYANGRRSIEGVGAVLAGIPALMREPFISSSFATNSFIGLGQRLLPVGYSTSFFHGGNNGTMYFDSFTKSAGMNKYFGSQEYPSAKDHDGAWGIYDGPFLQFMAHKLSEEPRPFFSTVFTLSSHQPYRIPDQVQARFKNGPIEILRSISYADDSLKEFFSAAEKTDWYKDTLFVITADHTQMHYRPEFQNDSGDYLVPLLFFHPKWKSSEERPKVNIFMPVQQIDIIPSILDLIGQDSKENILLSRSVFQDGPKYVSQFTEGRYLLFGPRPGDVLSWNPDSGEPQFTSKGSLPEIEKEKSLQTLKAHIQYFSEGLWDNVLYYPTGK